MVSTSIYVPTGINMAMTEPSRANGFSARFAGVFLFVFSYLCFLIHTFLFVLPYLHFPICIFLLYFPFVYPFCIPLLYIPFVYSFCIFQLSPSTFGSLLMFSHLYYVSCLYFVSYCIFLSVFSFTYSGGR